VVERYSYKVDVLGSIPSRPTEVSYFDLFIHIMKNVVLGVGAHPDDMDFTASGSIAKLIEEGWEGYYLICTDGSRGSRSNVTTHEELAKIRFQEQKEAGIVLGLKKIIFLDHIDTQLSCDVKLKEDIVKIIREIHPRVVITMDPAFLYTSNSLWSGKAFVNHTDHRAAAMATMDAVYPMARDRSIFPEHLGQGLDTHITEELWFTSFEQKGDYSIDITSSIDKKIRALEKHISQHDDFSEVKQEVYRHAQKLAEGENYKYAESFKRLIF
jgi:LmbE family N-acetylglucosaminyl deacetylase